MSERIQIMDIVRGTSVDGPGLRTAIYMAGCTHRCPGCQNPSTWDAAAGHPMTLDEIVAVISDEGNDVTLSGGDPLMHTEAVAAIAAETRRLGKTVWLYTGYTLEEIMQSPRLMEALRDVDVIVEGPFVEALRDPDLLFRGSSNQRIVRLHTSDAPVLWHNPFDDLVL